jgi:hypothetical protein
MIFDLSDAPIYSELKAWMLKNMNAMPNTMDSGHIYYLNPKSTAEILINRIDSRIELLGKEVQKHILARTDKVSLMRLYCDLQNKENWNLPMKKLNNEFSNYRNI